MKAILISGKPKWSALIMNGDKTKEIRKNKALAKAIQKLIDEYGYADIYWYCSKGKPYLHYGYNKYGREVLCHNEKTFGSSPLLNGKVLFKFRCYKVEELSWQIGLYELDQQSFSDFLDKSCLGFCELKNYLNKKNGFAIHISDLKIFDKPKELCDFFYLKPCFIAGDNTPRKERIHKAPQNFCYVEID